VSASRRARPAPSRYPPGPVVNRSRLLATHGRPTRAPHLSPPRPPTANRTPPISDPVLPAAVRTRVSHGRAAAGRAALPGLSPPVGARPPLLVPSTHWPFFPRPPFATAPPCPLKGHRHPIFYPPHHRAFFPFRCATSSLSRHCPLSQDPPPPRPPLTARAALHWTALVST
jgi:hypothetical protein